jgi:hypothetical protein
MTDDDALPKLTWPDVPRIAFGSDPIDGRLNARVGWVLSNPREMTGYIIGYKDAAEALFEHAKTVGSLPDFLLFPIAFMWRHAIELSLKEIIAMGRVLGSRPWGFPEHHRLADLWTEAKPLVISTGPQGHVGPEVANVEANILELETIDPSAQGFRYPVARNGGPGLQGGPTTLSLRLLHDAMQAVTNLLEGVSSVLQQGLDHMADGG